MAEQWGDKKPTSGELAIQRQDTRMRDAAYVLLFRLEDQKDYCTIHNRAGTIELLREFLVEFDGLRAREMAHLEKLLTEAEMVQRSRQMILTRNWPEKSEEV